MSDVVELERKLLALLRKRNIKRAVALANSQESTQWGISTAGNGKEVKEAGFTEDHLVAIFKKVPTLLKNVPPETLDQIRLIAGLYYLLNTRSLQLVKFDDDNFVPGTKIRPSWAPALIDNYVGYLNSVEHYRLNAKNWNIRVYTVNDGMVCPACKELHGKVFPLDELPELPYHVCTSEYGCRCYTQPGTKK